MKKKYLLLSIMFLILPQTGCTSGNAAVSEAGTEHITETDSIRLIFVGDVMGHTTQHKGAWRDGGDSCYNFIPTFQFVKEYISSADLAVANLEVTFDGEPYTGYPAFSSPTSLSVALKDAGFDLLVTANNHIMDRGVKGLERTLDALEIIGFAHTGSFRDSLAWKKNNPLIMNINGFRLAFLNYTYATNMAAPRPPFIVNYLDTMQIASDLDRCRAMNPDYIIACVHWGDEYQNDENETQREQADFLARNGCNLIVGSHPHVVQPMKKIAVQDADSALVAYSLGNFVSNQRWRYSDGGVMLDVTLTKTGDMVSLQSFKYEPFWVHRYPNNNVQIYRLILVDDYMKNPESYPDVTAPDEKMLLQFYRDTRRFANEF